MVTYELPNLSMVRKAQGMAVVPQEDRREAARWIIRLLQDDGLRRTMGREARQSAEELAGFDLTAHWQTIFAQALCPPEARQPLYRQPPVHTAIQLAMQLTAAGAAERARQPAPAAAAQDTAAADELHRLARQNAQYAAMVEELTHSTIFTAGRIVTYPLRKLKQLLQLLLKRSA